VDDAKANLDIVVEGWTPVHKLSLALNDSKRGGVSLTHSGKSLESTFESRCRLLLQEHQSHEQGIARLHNRELLSALAYFREDVRHRCNSLLFGAPAGSVFALVRCIDFAGSQHFGRRVKSWLALRFKL
jgi:hypothetical protein